MSIEDLLGRTATLVVRRLTAPGAYLELAPDVEDCLLVPHKELPEGVQPGDELSVFVYLDSSDRPIATTRDAMLTLHEVRFLEVTDLAPFGAFVDWGLPKDLLVPFAEQTCELACGDVHPFGLIRDASGRLAGTMRIRELLREDGDFEVGEWVDGEAWRKEPELGVFVLIERRFVGLLPAREVNALERGERASFRVAHVWPDGKIELSLRGLSHEEIADDARHVLTVLTQMGASRVSDRASPERIRALFGLSKKAFKRAVGRLLKEGSVRLTRDGELEPLGERR